MKLSPPETVLLAGALVLLASYAGWAGLAVRDWRLHRMVQRDFQTMDIAIYDYREKTKGLPLREKRLQDVRFGTPANPNRLLCEVLLGEPGKGGALNRGDVRYLRAETAGYRHSGVNGEGDWVDPWAQPYQVILDVDDNNVCDLPGTRYGSAIGVPVAIWSYGPDRKPETPDDIISWK